MKKLILILVLCFSYGILLAEANPLEPEKSKIEAGYGIFGNLNYNFHSPNFNRIAGISSCCPKFGEGDGFGFSVGLTYIFPIFNKFYVDLRGGLFTFDGKIEGNEYTTVNLDGEDVRGLFKNTIESSLISVGIEPMIGYNFWDNFLLKAGFHIGYLIKNDYKHYEEILEPSLGTFENAQRTRLNTSGELPNKSSLEYSLIAGISYDLALNSEKTFILTPEAYYSLGLSSIHKEEEWKVNTLRFGLALRYSPKEHLIPPKPELAATIQAFGVGADSIESPAVVMKVEEFLSTNLKPLLSYIFFEENSSDIPSRYKLLSPKEASLFYINNVHKLNPLEAHYHFLNIVGRRMLDYPEAKIAIDGCNSGVGNEKNNLDLSRKRAEAIRDYLQYVWGIQPDRMIVSGRNLPQQPSNINDKDGIVENQRAEITSNMWEIMAPIITDDTLRITNPPMVRFKTNVATDSKIVDWTISASQNNNNLILIRGKGDLPEQKDWRFYRDENSIPLDNTPLNYNLSVMDEHNQVYESEVKKLPVEQVTIQSKRREKVADKYIDRYSLILFHFDKSEIGRASCRERV